jgi:outer membrane murein-binding lipoprotein Lpp
MRKVIVASIVVAVVVLAGATYFAKRKYDSLLAATSQGLTLGKAYGKMTSQSSCILGLKMKYASCNTTDCELSANGYIAGCMEAAQKDGFCTDVPRMKNTDAALSWAAKTCSENGLSTGRCLKYIHRYVSVCTAQTEGRTLSKKEFFDSGVEKGKQR